MTMLKRFTFSAIMSIFWMLAGCAAAPNAPDAATLAALVPAGTLRVGVYQGSPTSMVAVGKSGDKAGVAHDLGIALGARLGVPVMLVEFARVAQVIDALKAGEVDLTFTNASESRARDVDFAPTLLRLELGYLVLKDSPIKALTDVDRPGMRVGVSQGSTSQGVLGRQFKNATLLPASSLQHAQDMLRQHAIDAFATNKGILFELSDALPNSRVLDGRWGYEALAIAIPKGRQAGMPYLVRFGQDMTANGQLQSMVQRAGLRGTARDE